MQSIKFLQKMINQISNTTNKSQFSPTLPLHATILKIQFIDSFTEMPVFEFHCEFSVIEFCLIGELCSSM